MDRDSDIFSVNFWETCFFSCAQNSFELWLFLGYSSCKMNLPWIHFLHTTCKKHSGEFCRNRNIHYWGKYHVQKGFSLNSSITFMYFLALVISKNHTNYSFSFWFHSIQDNTTKLMFFKLYNRIRIQIFYPFLFLHILCHHYQTW